MSAADIVNDYLMKLVYADPRNHVKPEDYIEQVLGKKNGDRINKYRWISDSGAHVVNSQTPAKHVVYEDAQLLRLYTRVSLLRVIT